MLDQIPYPRSYEDQRPGNEGPFYRSKGTHPQIEPTQYQQTAPDSLEGAIAAAAPTKKKITVQEYHHRKAAEEEHAATYLDEDENGEALDYEDFELQDDPANFQIGYQMPTPAPEETTEPTVPHESTIPKTVSGMPTHHAMAAANRAPGFGRGVPLAHASPMQIGTPVTSPRKTRLHGTTAEEMLLHGATLPCSLQQEAMLLNPPLLLTDNHIKMMDALCCLDTTRLQFICESVEALCRERMPAQPPPGYCTPQATDPPQGTTTNSPLSQEFYRATSNLSTAITRPPQQCPAEDRHPDPIIEDAVANMQRHEQVSQMPPTDRNQ